MAFDVPILFIVFNRPDTTAIVFEKIREIKPKKLFLAADGARPSKEGEKERCEAVRKIIAEGVDWDCDVQMKFSDINLGCGRAESSAMLWFFESVGEGIVIEDDTLPDSSFFTFCKELLEYYRNDESVRMIGGNNFQKGAQRGDGSYYFSKYTHSWGYASWWRAWEDYDFKLANINDDEFRSLLYQQFERADEREYWWGVYKNFRDGKYDTWDFQFLFTMWKNGGKTIIPNANLVTNMGFGNNATHTIRADDPMANISLGSIKKIVHPSNMKISDAADMFFFRNFLKPVTKWKRRFKKVMNIYNSKLKIG